MFFLTDLNNEMEVLIMKGTIFFGKNNEVYSINCYFKESPEPDKFTFNVKE